jgi:Zn-dependent M28 family amino/carboxypeptidase
MNEGTAGQTDSFSASLGRPAAIPVVGVSYAYGRELAQKAGQPDEATVRLVVDIRSTTQSTKNLLAELPPGENDTRPVVVVGAHLDSVSDGPGINDNGSGVAAVLLAASRLAEAARTGSVRLRFGFWGAEEIGLLGSRHYVNSLSEEERQRVALYVNLDMVGSPNFVRLVLADPGLEGPPGIAAQAMLEAFAKIPVPAERRAPGPLATFSTDMASFKGRGIPVIGLYTGSAEIKREDQVTSFGGRAGQPYDSCYHRACDTVENVNLDVVAEMAFALTQGLRAVMEQPRP